MFIRFYLENLFSKKIFKLSKKLLCFALGCVWTFRSRRKKRAGTNNWLDIATDGH